MKKIYRQRYLAKPKGKEAYRAARRTWQRKKHGYPISEQNCIELLASQNGKCGICKHELVWPDRNTHVDHDHKTGRIRGILCNRCNRAIGAFEDDSELLMDAAAYIARSIVNFA